MGDLIRDQASAPDDLADRLRSSADGPGERAAVAVLAAHGRWLPHPGFLLACVRCFREEIWIDWRVVRRFLTRTRCSALDHEILLLATDLARCGTGRRLLESAVFSQLDDLARRRFLEAIGPELLAVEPARGWPLR